jgi:hypothetical protein
VKTVVHEILIDENENKIKDAGKKNSEALVAAPLECPICFEEIKSHDATSEDGRLSV